MTPRDTCTFPSQRADSVKGRTPRAPFHYANGVLCKSRSALRLGSLWAKSSTLSGSSRCGRKPSSLASDSHKQAISFPLSHPKPRWAQQRKHNSTPGSGSSLRRKVNRYVHSESVGQAIVDATATRHLRFGRNEFLPTLKPRSSDGSANACSSTPNSLRSFDLFTPCSLNRFLPLRTAFASPPIAILGVRFTHSLFVPVAAPRGLGVNIPSVLGFVAEINNGRETRWNRRCCSWHLLAYARDFTEQRVKSECSLHCAKCPDKSGERRCRANFGETKI